METFGFCHRVYDVGDCSISYSLQPRTVHVNQKYLTNRVNLCDKPSTVLGNGETSTEHNRGICERTFALIQQSCPDVTIEFIENNNVE